MYAKRSSGIDIIGDIAWGTHLCVFYQTKEDLLDILVPYFSAGLRNNEFCIWVTAEPLGAEAAKKAMARKIADFDVYLKKGQIEIVPHSEWYISGGTFDSQRVLKAWVDKLDQALAHGYEGMRVTGNTAWLEKKDWRDFTAYEEEINSVIGKYPMLALCSYSLDRCGAFEILDVVKNHKFALIKREGRWEIIKSSRLKKMEEETRLSEEKFRAIYDNARGGILLADVENKKFYMGNKAICQALGYSLEEIKNLKVRDIHPQKDLPYVIDQFNGQAVGEFSLAKNIPVKRKDGSIFYADVNGTTITIAGKVYLMGFFRDITARKQAEEALRVSEERYSTVFQSAAGGILIAGVKTKKFLYANPAVCRMLGYAEEEMKQMRVDDIHPRADLDRVLSEFMALVRGKKTLVQDIPCLRKDGAIIYANVVATRAEIDGIDCCVGLFSDTTEQKRARENIERAAKEWRDTFDFITDMISLHDLNYRITRANRAFASAFGMKPVELIGRTCYELFHEMKEPHQKCPGKEALDRGESVRAEFFEPCLGRYLEVIASPLRDEGGKITGFVHVARDVTEDKKSEERALQSGKLAVVGELAAGIAHEIRNPLANISATAQYCLGKYELAKPLRRHLDVIVRNSENANRIIKDLLDFAKPHRVSLRLCSVREVIKKTCDVIKSRCAINRVRVKRRLARRLPLMLIEPDRMGQALMNFMINAIDSMPQGGTLIVTAESDPDKNEIAITIADIGKGIPEDELPKIFDPFFSTKREGVGLGLSLAHQIIDQHKGIIDVQSGVGKGTTVTVRLPVAPPPTHTIQRIRRI
jgi:PAS domain S-box-containing protein